MNNRGFTLIESVITFAIIAIAGGMFLLGFYNVSVLASEGSIIKTETDTLYNELVAEEPTTHLVETENQKLTLTIEGESTPVQLDCTMITGEVNPGFKIVLNKYRPVNILNNWIDSSINEDETVNAEVRFYIRWIMSGNQIDFPSNDLVDINLNGQNGVMYGHFVDKIYGLKKISDIPIYNANDVNKCLNYQPTTNELKTITGYDPNQGDILWYQIQKDLNGYNVIGFQVPKLLRKATIVLDVNGNILINHSDTNWKKEDSKGDYEKDLKPNVLAKSIRDGKDYSYDQIFEKRNDSGIKIYTKIE